MNETQKQQRAATRRHRPRRIPPPVRSSGEAFEAAPAIDELSGDRAVLLWKTARSVELWADLPEADRAEAFPPGAHAARLRLLEAADPEPELAGPLRTAAGILDRSAQPREVAAACRDISLWAKREGAVRTALLFMQAAALVRPEDAQLAIEVGRLARDDRDLGRAESWFRQAISVGRQAGSWKSHGIASLALATVLKDRGNYPAARKTATRALRSARRHSLREVEGRAHHDLMELGIAMGQGRAVTEHARGALQAYGPRHPRLPVLANDLAYHWMERGYFSAALRVYRSLDAASFATPRERLFLCANLARAAGGAAEEAAFEAAWEEAHRWMADPQAAAGAAAALLDLAQGALSLGCVDRVTEAAGRSLELAREQGQGRISLQAEALLGAARPLLAPERPQPAPPRAVPARVGELAEALTAAM